MNHPHGRHDTEVKAQMQEAIGRQPNVAMACVGGSNNAIGLFPVYWKQYTPHRCAARFPQLLIAGRQQPSARHTFRFRQHQLSQHQLGTPPFGQHRPRGIHGKLKAGVKIPRQSKTPVAGTIIQSRTQNTRIPGSLIRQGKQAFLHIEKYSGSAKIRARRQAADSTSSTTRRANAALV